MWNRHRYPHAAPTTTATRRAAVRERHAGIGPFPTEDKVDADLINAGKQTVTNTCLSIFGSHELRRDPRW